MIRGIGIDMVDIRDIERFLDSEGLRGPFLRRTFTEAELAAAPDGQRQRAEYFAAHFAAKEAVFKALAYLTQAKSFDMRIVETLNRADGSPYVNITGTLRPILDEVEVHTLHISLTTEGDYATAFIIAEGTGE